MRTSLLIAAFALAACSHTRPEEMTAEEHRAEARRHEQVAAAEERQYEPNEVRPHLGPRSPFVGDEPGLEFYNPSAAHLAQADRDMAAALEHLDSADKLEKFEDTACAGIPPAERAGCPLLAPYLVSVQEIAQGLTLNLKPTAPSKTLVNQMSCHLAYAMAKGFEKAPCPLYVKGVKIALVDERTIDIRSMDPKVAHEVRLEARRLFGAPAK